MDDTAPTDGHKRKFSEECSLSVANDGTFLLDTSGDLLVHLYHANDTSMVVIAKYQVNSEKLKEASESFHAMLSPRWKSGHSASLLGTDHPQAMALWLQILHSNIDSGTYKLDIVEIWNAIQVKMQSAADRPTISTNIFIFLGRPTVSLP